MSSGTTCNKAKKPVYTDWKLESSSKKKESEFIRNLTGYKARCTHEIFQTGAVLIRLSVLGVLQ